MTRTVRVKSTKRRGSIGTVPYRTYMRAHFLPGGWRFWSYNLITDNVVLLKMHLITILRLGTVQLYAFQNEFFLVLQLSKRMHNKFRRHAVASYLLKILLPLQLIKEYYSNKWKTKRYRFLANLLDPRTINVEDVMKLTLSFKVKREEPSKA